MEERVTSRRSNVYDEADQASVFSGEDLDAQIRLIGFTSGQRGVSGLYNYMRFSVARPTTNIGMLSQLHRESTIDAVELTENALEQGRPKAVVFLGIEQVCQACDDKTPSAFLIGRAPQHT